MFFENDNVPVTDRMRLFNIFIAPELPRMAKTTGIPIIVINLQESNADKAVEILDGSLTKLKEKLIDLNCLYLYAGNAQKILEDKDITQLKIAQVMFGPKGTMCLSAWKIPRDVVIKSEAIDLLMEPNESIHENPWFSEDRLKEQFELILDQCPTLFQTVSHVVNQSEPHTSDDNKVNNQNKLPVVILNGDYELMVKYFELKDLLCLYKTYMLNNLKDVQKYMLKGNTLLFVRENYFRWYPLVIQYNNDSSWKISK